MKPPVTLIKEAVEKIVGCRIYRNGLPHGVASDVDIAKRFGRDAIKLIFDVGANYGQSACSYLNQFPQAEIYSFEPVAATYQKLIDATRSFARIRPYQLGMGREAGRTTINVGPESMKSSIVIQLPEDHPETIEIETVAGFAGKHRLDIIDFLKVDTEGFDLEVLVGAKPLLKSQKIHFIQVECAPVARSKRFASFCAVGEFMGTFGYELFGIYEQQPEWDGRNRVCYFNAVFICEKLIAANSRLERSRSLLKEAH